MENPQCFYFIPPENDKEAPSCKLGYDLKQGPETLPFAPSDCALVQGDITNRFCRVTDMKKNAWYSITRGQPIPSITQPHQSTKEA